MATKQRSKSSPRDLSATIQWVALVGVFLLVVVAVFVFQIGGTGTGGGHSG